MDDRTSAISQNWKKKTLVYTGQDLTWVNILPQELDPDPTYGKPRSDRPRLGGGVLQPFL